MKKNAFTRFVATGALMAGLPFVSYAQSPNPPETTLEAPTHAQEEVLALYSDTYTVADDMPTLVGTEFSEVKIGDNNVWHVKIGSGSGPCYLEFTEPLDLSDYNTFFIDVYAVEQNAFNFRIRLNGANSPNQLQLQVKTGWNRLEFDLNDFNLLNVVPDLTAVSRINFVGEGARTIYIDNVYACKALHSDMAFAPAQAAPAPTQKESDVLAIFSDVYDNEIGAKLDATTVGNPAAIKVLSYDGNADKMIFVKNGKTGNGGLNFGTAVDITPYDSLHFDIYPVGNSIPMRVKIAGISNQGTLLKAETPDAWNAMDVAIADWQAKLKDTDNPDLINVQTGGFWLFRATGYESTFFLDNVFFYKTRSAEDPGEGTGIEDLSAQDLVSVSTQGDMVTLSSDVTMATVQVYTLAGRQVMALQDLGYSAVVNLEAEQAGLYLFQVTLNNGETITKKILSM